MGRYKKIGLSREMGLIDTAPLSYFKAKIAAFRVFFNLSNTKIRARSQLSMNKAFKPQGLYVRSK